MIQRLRLGWFAAIACLAASAHLERLPTLGIGASRVSRGAAPLVDVREHRAPVDDGFEQSWSFPQRPAGSGDVVVTVEVATRFLGADADGLHFEGTRYGHATWIDATGARTAITSRFDGEDIRLEVPDALLGTSTFPAVLDPFVGPELSFGVPVRGRPSHYDFEPVVGFNGLDYFVSWVDYRRWRQCDVYATRVGTDGGVFDPLLQLSATAARSATAEVARPEVSPSGAAVVRARALRSLLC